VRYADWEQGVTMARIKIELTDTEDGGMQFDIDAEGLATWATAKTNTTVQNAAILLIEVLKECGIDKGQLPDLTARKRRRGSVVYGSVIGG
jgi:xylose isomerase